MGAGIALRNVAAGYGGAPAVERVSGRFAPGSLTAVVGPNGAGKSTLLKAVVGLLPLAAGTIAFDGCARADLGYLPQAAALDRTFPISAFEVAAMGHWRRCGWFRPLSRVQLKQVSAALEAVGLAQAARTPFGALSAGQMQRVLFARLIVQDAPAVLLDEPFAALDHDTATSLMALVRSWHESGRTVIAVLHDLGQVRAQFPATLLLARAPVAWGETARVLTPDNLARARAGTWGEVPPLERAA